MSDQEFPSSRRRFLAGSLAAAASAPSFGQIIATALATPAQRVTGTLADVGHVIFLMQENRSFDHYFGTLAGVRGFSDPRAIHLPGGKPVWYQPYGSSHVLPYHYDIRNTNALRIGLNHSWKGSETIWKDWSAWTKQKTVRTMGYFDRGDLPFYYALADAFTVCDRYHCSVFGPTDPNRFYALSGHTGGHVTGIPDSRLYNVTNGIYNADIANDNPAAKGIEWQSYAEILEANQISWKVYQEWDNYGDNYLQYFRNFRVDAQGRKLTPESPLFQKCRALAPGSTAANAAGTSGQFLIDEFARDVREGRLPAVSWICAPTEYCEHPEETPNAGEHFTARLLAALVANPEVWAKTVLVLTYDENDGFFDHVPSVMAAVNANQGISTVGNAGEIYAGSEPIGVGPRVPTLVISPWSKGGKVNSQLFDHTSLLRFLEEWLVQGRGLARSAVQCPYISPWRRAVCGDLLSTLDLRLPDARWPEAVPATAHYFRDWGSADALPPAVQRLPVQERVAGPLPRAACPLPYRSSVRGAVQAGGRQFALAFANSGSVGEAFIVYSGLRSDGPWHYTLGAGARIDREVWNWSGDRYHLAVLGNNGYSREFAGRFGADAPRVEVLTQDDPVSGALRIVVNNLGSSSVRLRLRQLAYGQASEQFELAPRQAKTLLRPLQASHGWYDFGLQIDGDEHYWRRLSGHLEGAGMDRTDPVLNGLANAEPSPWPGSTVTPPAVQFSASASQIGVGGSVDLVWKQLPAGNRHWLGVYKAGQTPGLQGSLRWNYVAAPDGQQTLSGLAAGDYFLGLFLDDGYEPAAPYLPLKVG